MKILILKPSSFGDVIQAIPVLRLIKRHRPNARVSWWLDEDLLPVLKGDPDLEAVIPFPRRRLARREAWSEFARGIMDVRRTGFDWVIDLQALARSAGFAWFAGGTRTIGLGDFREGAPLFYDEWIRRPADRPHAVDWYLDVLPALGVPRDSPFEWMPARQDWEAGFLERWTPLEGRWVAFQPGARWNNKRWPPSHFIELGRRILTARPDSRIVVFGSRGDRALGRSIADALPGGRVLDLTGLTNVGELTGWLRRVRVLVTNDTGPMHLAVAVGCPVVALFGPTHPDRTGPYGQREACLGVDLECVPCLRRECRWPRPMECLSSLVPERVLERVIPKLDRVHDRPAS